MSNSKKSIYTTLASTSSHEEGVKYQDRDSLPFEAVYPLIKFEDDTITKNHSTKIIEKHLSKNFWYQKANSTQRAEMLKRVAHVNSNIQIILDFIESRYGHFDQDCIHISIAGSYIHSPAPGDIDLDVVLEGSFFDYSYFNEGIELLDTTGSISKISLTVMGADNISGKKLISSDIDNQGFRHQDTILREILIAPMRNVTVYGRPFKYPDSLDERNIIVRIARQLYFAALTLEGKIPYYDKDPLKTKKALSRIREAHDILEWLFLSIERD